MPTFDEGLDQGTIDSLTKNAWGGDILSALFKLDKVLRANDAWAKKQETDKLAAQKAQLEVPGQQYTAAYNQKLLDYVNQPGFDIGTGTVNKSGTIKPAKPEEEQFPVSGWLQSPEAMSNPVLMAKLKQYSALSPDWTLSKKQVDALIYQSTIETPQPYKPLSPARLSAKDQIAVDAAQDKFRKDVATKRAAGITITPQQEAQGLKLVEAKALAKGTSSIIPTDFMKKN